MILLCTKDCKHKHIYVLLFIHYFCCACLQIYVHVCVWLCKTQPHLIDSTRHSSEYYWDLLYIHSTLYGVVTNTKYPFLRMFSKFRHVHVLNILGGFTPTKMTYK